MELTNISTVRELMSRYGVDFTKSLGQNFIINPSVCPRIADLSGITKDSCVLEVGAGIGVLTRELCTRAEKVVCVELDRTLFPLLDETLGEFDNLKLVQGDIMKIDLHTLLEQEFPGRQVTVCANLPYYITSPVIMRLLEENLPVEAITVMVQKEAAARICAPVPSREAGAISVAVRYYAEPQILFGVSRGSFLPAPNVDSAVIKLTRHTTPPVSIAEEDRLFRVIRGAFSQRRKMLVNCLSSSLGLPKDIILTVLESAGIPATARAEQLALADFASIANALSAREG